MKTQTPLEKAREATQARREAGVAIVRKNPNEKRLEQPKSLRRALNAMRYECMGMAPGYRREIRDCTAPNCPLFALRPYQANDDEEETDPLPSPGFAHSNAATGFLAHSKAVFEVS